MDKLAFLNGISAKANELFLTREIRDEILKLAGLFKHDDDLNSIIQQGGLKSELEAATLLAKHMAPPALAAGAGGSVLGAGLGRLFTKDKKEQNKNTAIGAGLGGLLGAAGGGVNDLRQLQENTPAPGSDW